MNRPALQYKKAIELMEALCEGQKVRFAITILSSRLWQVRATCKIFGERTVREKGFIEAMIKCMKEVQKGLRKSKYSITRK